MISKTRLIETVCGISLQKEFKHLPNEDLDHSMVAETPEVFALLAEKIAEDQNELELKKMDFELKKLEITGNHQNKLDERTAMYEKRRAVEIEQIRSNERVKLKEISANIAHHRWDVINKSLIGFIVGGSTVGTLYLLMPWGI